MIHGYHVILTMYGYWLPNDPRGSWSDFVGRWELVQFGRPRRTILKKSLLQLTPQEIAARNAAQLALLYPPVSLDDDEQVKSIAAGFDEVVRKSGYTIWACAVMPQHTHLVIARHTYKVEQIATLLKGGATRRIVEDGRHPMQKMKTEGQLPSMWARGCWKVYLDNDEAIMNAIRYVDENPVEEGKPRQHWPWVAPYQGLDSGWVTYH